MKVPGLDRLGIAELIKDHQSTLYRIDANGVHHPRRADKVVMWGLPLMVAGVAMAAGVRLQDTGPVLNGVAIVTGGLFGLLVMIFGVQALGGSQSHRRLAVVTLVRETRANVAYATAWSLLITATVMLVGAFREAPDPLSAEPDPGVNPILTGLILGMLTHLGLTLLMVLNRIRLAFSKIDESGSR